MRALAYVAFAAIVFFAIGMAVGYPCGRCGVQRRRAFIGALAGFLVLAPAPFALMLASGSLAPSDVDVLTTTLWVLLAVACALPYLGGVFTGHRWGANLRAWSRSAASRT